MLSVKPRKYDPVKSSWLASCMVALSAIRLVFRGLQAIRSTPALAVPKQHSFRLVSDYMAVNEKVEKISPGPMPNQGADMLNLLSARFFGKLDLFQGYWQIPFAEEAQKIFFILFITVSLSTISLGMITPTLVPRRVLNVYGCFQ